MDQLTNQPTIVVLLVSAVVSNICQCRIACCPAPDCKT